MRIVSYIVQVYNKSTNGKKGTGFYIFVLGVAYSFPSKNTKQNKHTVEYIHYKNNTLGLTASIHTDSLSIYC